MRRRRVRIHRPRLKRGVALVLTLMLTFAMGALAMGAIYLQSNGQLLGLSAEREKELRYAADAALQVGKSRLNNDPFAMPDTGYATLVSNGAVLGANGQAIAGVTYNLWAGPTGSTTGQFGRFGSVVAEAIGPRGARFVRRLELQQESFARYAYWTNKEKTSSGGTIYFASGDVLWGPVWSNDYITIHSTGATFHNDVTTAKQINSPGYATFDKGYTENADPITLPTVTTLAKLPGYAAAGNLSFAPPTTGAASGVRMRVEFVAVDLNNDGDSTDVDEGFIKVYQANTGNEDWLRADWTTTKTSASNCGDFHRVLVGTTKVWKFFPASVHGTSSSTSWARNMWIASGDYTSGTSGSGNIGQSAYSHGNLSVADIMSKPLSGLSGGQPPHRCYPGGDPHLVAAERSGASGQIAGEDSTFTPNGSKGAWRQWTGAIDPRLAAKRPWDAGYLFPLYRGQNGGSKGVLYFSGTVAVSGTLRGRTTLYAKNNVVYIDDVRYATDPATGVCNDMLGVIAGENIIVADNAINDPPNANGYRNLDDTKDLYLHGVQMAIDESFTVENYDSGPTNANDCEGDNDGRGCLYLLGGIIQERRGAVGLTNGSGYIKRYSYDRCAVQIPPPYFPTTGRFTDNRYMEIDPGRFNVAQLFQSLSPNW